MEFEIRPATLDDVPGITEIYNQWIVDSHVSFDDEPWTIAQREEWFAKYSDTGPYRCLVATAEDGSIAGTSYSSPFRNKAGYRRSVETTVVIGKNALGAGLGRHLLMALLAVLATEPLHRAYAMIALPNEASVNLHLKLGYRSIGILDEVGYKHGRPWSTQLLELQLDNARPTAKH